MKQNIFLGTFYLLLVCVSTSQKPNIIFIWADDMGWNDVGFHGSNQFPTPNIDALAYSGTILKNYYSQQLCTPSRSALLTGIHPINNGMYHDVIYAAEPWGVPLKNKLLPQYLKDLGYTNHAVGKWHLGFFKSAYTPTFRGFNSHVGYWLGHQHYYTHLVAESGFNAFDFRRNMDPFWDAFGNYTTDIITDEAEKIIKNHDTVDPLFLYVAHSAVHAPLEAPQELIDSFIHIKSIKRKKYAAMMTVLDQSVGRIVAALEAKGMLDNSIVVFTNDNGGATHGYNDNVASNWPLRGGKETLWEGGVKVPAVIWSPLLKTAPHIHHGLVSVLDWLPTFITAVNGTLSKEAAKGKDGHNQWDTLLGLAPEPSDELLHNFDNSGKTQTFLAFRKGEWKIISGQIRKGGYDGWYGNETSDQLYNVYAIQNSLVAKAVNGTNKPLPDKETMINIRNETTVRCFKNGKKIKPCNPKRKTCLFNIVDDPCEKNNLAKKFPDVLKELEHKLKHDYHPVPRENKHSDPAADPAQFNNTWAPWKDSIRQQFFNLYPEVIKSYY